MMKMISWSQWRRLKSSRAPRPAEVCFHRGRPRPRIGSVLSFPSGHSLSSEPIEALRVFAIIGRIEQTALTFVQAV
jgi:hypothetical protein